VTSSGIVGPDVRYWDEDITSPYCGCSASVSAIESLSYAVDITDTLSRVLSDAVERRRRRANVVDDVRRRQ